MIGDNKTMTRLRMIGKITAMIVLASGCADNQGGLNLGVGPSQSRISETEAVAEAALAGGSYAEAARLYERAVEETPGSASAYLGLGRAYIAMGQYSRADFALQRARVLDRRNPEILNAQAELKLQKLRPAEAIELYDQALSRDRKNLSALTGKAVSLDFLSRHAEAQVVYQRALQHYPTNFILLNNYALSLALSGQVAAGLKILQELVRDPENGEAARGNMAIAYALDGREREARAVLEGTMSSSEIESLLAEYADMRRRFKSGKPIGYLIFN